MSVATRKPEKKGKRREACAVFQIELIWNVKERSSLVKRKRGVKVCSSSETNLMISLGGSVACTYSFSSARFA